MSTTDPNPTYSHVGVHIHRMPNRRDVGREHDHRHQHELEDKSLHDLLPYAHLHSHAEADQQGGKLVQIDDRPLAEALAEAQRLRDEADKADSPSIAKSYRDLARKLDPPEDPELLAHDAAYYLQLAEQTAGESLSLSKGYRQMAERREIAGARRQPRPTSSSRPTVPFLAKSQSRR